MVVFVPARCRDRLLGVIPLVEVLRQRDGEHLVSGIGFRISGFGFRFSGLGFQVSGLGFGFRVSGSRASGFRFRVVSDFGFRVYGYGIGA